MAGLDAIETASRDEIAALQRERLAWTLRHAYTNVPHYRAAFDRAGVHPDDFRTLDDLAKFPFTTKQDLRANYPFGMFAVPREKLVRVHASSGTTGKPTVVGYTAKDIETWAHVVARSIYAAGGRPGMIVHVAYGYGLFTGGLGAHYGAEKLGCTVVPVSGGMTERQVQLITDFRPDVIMVTPSYMLAILDEFRRQGLDPRDCSLKIGIFGAEPWTNAMRREIEDGFAMDAVDIYGLSEVMGPGVANECVETKDGLHIWEDHFYPEVIDPETGAVLPEGERGELVFTSLTKEGMPVVRYRTRDLTRLLPGTARTMRRMEKVTGRSDDMVIVRGVNMFPTQVEEQLLKSEVLTGHYQIVLTREGRMDEVAVHVEARPEYFDPVLLEAEAKVVVARIKDTIGLTDARGGGAAGDDRAFDRQGAAGWIGDRKAELRSVPDVLRPEAHADDACRQPPQQREPPEHPHRERRLRRRGAAQHVADDAVLDRHLHALRHARRPFAPALHGAQVVQRRAALAQPRHQDVGGGDRVLDRQVDADAADRRHRMRGIADAQQAGPKPGVQPVHRHGQQLHIVPDREFLHAVAQIRRQPHDLGAERLQPARVHLVDAALGNDERALPVVVAIQHDEDAAGVDAAERLAGIVRRLRQAQPQHVHRRAAIRSTSKPARVAQGGVAAIGGDDQVGALISSAPSGTLRGHADHAVAFADQAGGLGAASAGGRSESASPDRRGSRGNPIAA